MTGDLNATFEHRPIYTPRRFYVFMRRATISNFSFKRSFQAESMGSTPKGLTLEAPRKFETGGFPISQT